MRSSAAKWLVVLGICGGIACVFCCGGVVFIGFNFISEEVRALVERDPRFTEHVGQITSFRCEMAPSLTNGEDDVMMYHVDGTKWSGRVTIKHVTDDNGDEKLVWVKFTLPSGEKVELTEPFP